MAFLPNSFYPNSTNPSGFVPMTNGSGTFPSTTTLLVPVSIDIFGGQASILGTPIGFINILISGLLRKIPFYS